jgi:transposase-like protein
MQKQRAVRVRRDETEWAKILKQLRTSGSTQAEFCRSRGLSVTTLQQWARRLKAPGRSAFVDLTPSVNAAEESAWQIEVQLPAGILIRLKS